MPGKSAVLFGVLLAILSPILGQTSQDSAYLTWSQETVDAIGSKMRVNGRVGGFFDGRITHTEKSYNYKLRATWLTPEAIRANARWWQLKERLTDLQTQALVAEAEAAGDTVVMVELDPREGSGIIPSDWIAILRSKGGTREVKGTVVPALRNAKALSGTFRRDYAYDVFWVVFHLMDDKGEPVFSNSATEAELLVSINNKQGQVNWPIPDSLRKKNSL